MKTIIAATIALTLSTGAALAWGDDGHKVVALIAEHYLTPSAKKQVDSLLAADTDGLTAHDIASEATWADRYRDSNNRRDHYNDTKNWHFVDLEIEDPDITKACFGRKPLPSNTPASIGPPSACVVDKITQFAAELEAPGTDAEERLFALKFLLHFVGDMHQPLHASDNGDAGGNSVKVVVDGFDHKARDNLHSYWDTQFVDVLGRPPAALAKQLLAQIKPAQEVEWRQGTPSDWAMEAFNIAFTDAYGDPPLSKDGLQHLDTAYVERAKADVALQLSRAGVRLALVLNRALGGETVPVR
jgi:S1/P1 Nuclease